MKRILPSIMVFLSGFAGLVYQVLWMRQLGLLFGNTAHAAAATLAIFFAGLAAGSWFWGRRVSVSAHPLKLYGWIELGIAGTALVYFGILSLFYLIYPSVYQAMGTGGGLFLIKCLLAMALVFPPAFCMGGTIPVMGEFLIVRPDRFAVTAAWMYGINTLGAALGAFMAVFFCVPYLGFNLTCVSAMGLTGGIAAAAFLLARSAKPTAKVVVSSEPHAAGAKNGRKANPKTSMPGPGQPVRPIDRPTIFFLAFVSGFSVLALEVLWTRMFAQIHENSVYSFACVLVIVLVCLSLGALIAAILSRMKISSRHCLSILLVASGVILSLSPWIFLKWTHNINMLSTRASFGQYFMNLLGMGCVTVAPACLLLGTIFPFLMKSEECFSRHPGRSIGYLSAINTLGAILGSVLCGFVLLQVLGMWWTVQSIAVVYLLIGVVLPAGTPAGMVVLRIIGVGFIILVFTGLNPSGWPVVGGDPRRGPQEIIEVWETSDCTVSVSKTSSGNYTIKINSNYILGSTGAFEGQIFQARIPLFIYPETESIFFLGLGTGITAGGALDRDLFPAVQRVVACEMVPEVVTAARRYMTEKTGEIDYTQGLFTDPRVQILVEDGRHYLMATDETFDMINADLFLPYRSGAGSLYSREHFQKARERLNPDGVFVQWLPLYQITDFEFGTIARTMLSVFDQITLWRNNFTPGSEVVALVGHNSKDPIPASDLPIQQKKLASVVGLEWFDLPKFQIIANAKTVSLFYGGNLTESSHLFTDYPVNTDDRPVIEYRAPRSLREKRSTRDPTVFVGPRLSDLVDRLLENCPPDADPMLVRRTVENRRLPTAGAALHRAWIAYAMQDADACRKAWETFVVEWINHEGEISNEND